MKISASFLSVKENLKNNIQKLDKTTIDYLHLDIMDGYFVDNKTWNIGEIKELLENTTKPLDIHLMVRDVFKYIDDYRVLDPSFITFHLEAIEKPEEAINYLKQNDIKVGMSIKPTTQISNLEPYLGDIDLILLMSVEPGMGEQSFMNSTIEKIELLNQLRKENNYNYVIEVDGGINAETIHLCNKADILVVGSYITKSDDYQIQIDKLQLKNRS